MKDGSIRWGWLAMVLAGVWLGGCATAPTTEAGKMELEQKAANTLDSIRQKDPSLADAIKDAEAYAVLPSVGKGGAGVGGAYGRGVLYDGGKVIGYCDLSQGSIGFQLGGQVYSELILFQTQAAVDDFKQGNMEFSAQATAVAVDAGAGANINYENGVAVFTLGEKGLMYEASIGGQKFSYEPKQ